MDDFHAHCLSLEEINCVVIGTCNNIDRVDQMLCRGGRLAKDIAIVSSFSDKCSLLRSQLISTFSRVIDGSTIDLLENQLQGQIG